MQATKCVAYLRVSGKGQESGDGFERQRIAIDLYAKQNGFEIEAWFQDVQTGKDEWGLRPGWCDMMASLNGTSIVIVEKLDRVARRVLVQELILADMQKRGVTILTSAGDDTSDEDPERTMFRQMMAVFAQYERTVIVMKLRGARRRKREATGKCEGPKLYGDRPGEHQALHRMQSLRQSGSTFSCIANTLNEQGIRTRHNLRWSPGTVCKILGRQK